MSQRNEELLFPAKELLLNEKVEAKSSTRVNAMDIQRGLIMLLMAFSHCREYVGVPHYSNLHWNIPTLWLGTSAFDLFQQIIISTIVAPGFFMMMGVGIVFLYRARLKEGWSLEKICQYFLFRGALLIFLQLTVLQLFEFIAEEKIYFYAGVLLSLGFCMILAALCFYFASKCKQAFPNYTFEYSFPAALAIIIVLFMHHMVTPLAQNHAAPDLWQIVFLLGGIYQNGVMIDINFTPLPWLPATLVGLIVGQLIYAKPKDGFKKIFYIASSFLALWFILQTGNLLGWFSIGEFKITQASDPFSLAAYFSMSKYPPSLTFLLWGLGINLLCLCGFRQLEKMGFVLNWLNPLKVFGQCALFFFLIHWFIYFGISLILSEALHSATGIGVMWFLGLCLLYPLCKQYYAFKMKQAKDSIWRMF